MGGRQQHAAARCRLFPRSQRRPGLTFASTRVQVVPIASPLMRSMSSVPSAAAGFSKILCLLVDLFIHSESQPSNGHLVDDPSAPIHTSLCSRGIVEAALSIPTARSEDLHLHNGSASQIGDTSPPCSSRSRPLAAITSHDSMPFVYAFTSSLVTSLNGFPIICSRVSCGPMRTPSGT